MHKTLLGILDQSDRLDPLPQPLSVHKPRVVAQVRLVEGAEKAGEGAHAAIGTVGLLYGPEWVDQVNTPLFETISVAPDAKGRHRRAAVEHD